LSKFLDLIEKNAIKNSNSNIMSNNTSSSSSSIFPSLLTVLFIGLKLTGHITWSWWWVLSPLWISALIGLTILSIVLIIAVATGFFK
jgi:divalent metal cation (Fe/Co/Zn/Cd) transporter